MLRSRPTLHSSDRPSTRPVTLKPPVVPNSASSKSSKSIPSMGPRSSPTTGPTIYRTEPPTMIQPAVPTVTSSKLPSQGPISPANPTSKPTVPSYKKPVNKPTLLPSNKPTFLFSTTLTSSPSNRLSTHPGSLKPSSEPSVQSSNKPTNEPTVLSSNRPSIHQSTIPTTPQSDRPVTFKPSAIPNAASSKSSKSHPLMGPSSSPTTGPTTYRTEPPTMFQHAVPTGTSSKSPSQVPISSAKPTTKPTVPSYIKLTNKPTLLPSNKPTFLFSTKPTTSPSNRPSTLPGSLKPSSKPSIQSGNKPTNKPTLLPSNRPSIHQSTNPPSDRTSTRPVTLKPSSIPNIASSKSSKSHPSMGPSSSPTTGPITNHTEHPSIIPTPVPTTISSKSPSRVPSSAPFTSLSESPSECRCDINDPQQDLKNLTLSSDGSFNRLLMTSSIIPHELAIDDFLLSSMMEEPPRVASNFHTYAPNHIVVDVVSIGSEKQIDLLLAQQDTWGSHNSIRNFWGFTEFQDFFGCSSMSIDQLDAYFNTCQTLPRGDQSIQDFFTKYYGMSEGNRSRTDDSGWLCAQRRLGRAFGWLHHQYSKMAVDMPDYLFLVDDDTFVDTEDVLNYLQEEYEVNDGLVMRAGCLFHQDSVVPFNFAYGGFGLFLNKHVITQMARPVRCNNIVDHDDVMCPILRRNILGEFDIFRDGMSLFEIFYRLSAVKNFCMHSDWLSGYIMEFYLAGSYEKHSSFQVERNNRLRGIKEYPVCGNMTAFTHSMRYCTVDSQTCHSLSPADMEMYSLASYAESPSSYRKVPILADTDLYAIEDIGEKRNYSRMTTLPNVLLMGAPMAGSSLIADWFYSNGACIPRVFDDEPHFFNKEAHFFDHEDRYIQGINFYAKRFEHCLNQDNSDILLDATPDYFIYPERVFDLYSQESDSFSSLKLVVILREPVTREISLFTQKVEEYAKNHTQSAWFSDILFPNGTIMTFDQYSDFILMKQLSSAKIRYPGRYVDYLKLWTRLFSRHQLLVLNYDELMNSPKNVQWRLTEFLQLADDVERPLESAGKHLNRGVPSHSAQILQEYFNNPNEELYLFIDSARGPWMEQYPFPRFNSPARFAYVTVLGWSPNSSQNQIYLDAVRVLIRSLRQSTFEGDIIVLMTHHDTDIDFAIREEKAIIKVIDPIEYKHDVVEFEPWFVDIALLKLRAFQLTNYDRIQLLDADVAIDQGRSLDALFNSFPDAKLVSEGLGADSPLRAGWMMIKPSDADFDEMQHILRNGSFDKLHGWDGLDLPVKYPLWKKSKDESIPTWSFYGSNLEQGLLFHYFYSLPKSKDPSANDFELLRLVSDDELLDLGLVHFYGERKPWSKIKARLPAPVIAAQDGWLKVYRSLKIDQGHQYLPEYVVPLTTSGFEQYRMSRFLYESLTFAPSFSPSSVIICDCLGNSTG